MATDADFHAKTGLGLERGGEPLEHVEETIIGHARATLIFVDACETSRRWRAAAWVRAVLCLLTCLPSTALLL
jgi:hypothetical protein